LSPALRLALDGSRLDLSDPRAIDALVDVLPDGIDGLVNNAGLPPTRPAEQLLAINLLTVKHLTAGHSGNQSQRDPDL